MMKKKIEIVLFVLAIIILLYFTIINLMPRFEKRQSKNYCENLRSDFKKYVLDFQGAMCLQDSDCVGIGNRVGTCGFCVSSNVDLTVVEDFDSKYGSSECYNFLSDTNCLAVERICKCINDKCQFE